MEIRRSLTASCPPGALWPYVDDLDRYAQWMPLIHEVSTDPDAGPERPAWNVELRAKVGPLARSKRLRMVRTVHEQNRRAVFERDEVDGRNHAPWILTADLDGGGAETELTMTLVYGGRLWTGGVLERVLDEQIRQGSEALLGLVTAPTR